MTVQNLGRWFFIVGLVFLLLAVSCISQEDAPEPPEPHYCYFCRSDRNSNCLKKPGKTPSMECTNQTQIEFQDELERDPPQKPVPHYTRTTAISRWGCYFMISSDQTFALRTCAVIPEHQEDGCNHCKFGGHWAWCCYCQSSNCNAQLSHGSRPVLMVGGRKKTWIINTFTIGLFTSIFHFNVKTCYA